MGYSKTHIAETRKRIVETAGRLFRKRGRASVTVSEVMAAAGLTHGGFYAHFRSKSDLFDVTIAEDFDFTKQLQRLVSAPELNGRNVATLAAKYYLEPENAKKVAAACTMTSSASDVAVSGRATRKRYTSAFERLLKLLEKSTRRRQSAQRERDCLSALAICVGGLTLARAIDDPALAHKLLSACQNAAVDQLNG